MNLFIYQLKIQFRDRMKLFWTLLFPVILATFFHLAFSNLLDNEHFEPAKVAIVQTQHNDSFQNMIHELSQENENQLLEAQYVQLDQAQQLLNQYRIDGYIVIDEDIELTVNESGIQESIIQAIIDQYNSLSHTMRNIYEINPQAMIDNLNENYFEERNIQNTDLTVIYFYTLIGMNCMFASFSSISAATKIEGNLSRQGTRITMSPLSKYKILFSTMLSVFIIHYIKMMILLIYLIYGLGVEFGNQIGYIALLIAIGSFTGIAIGNWISCIFKGSENTKTTIGTALSMLCSFFAGMMIIDIKYLVLEYFPIGAYINPVNLITDALYSLYYYTTYDRYFFNLFCLIMIGILFSLISIIYMRRKQYDSI